ncbi:MAG: alpha-beta hydrolase superfamily lysophospholipase [Oceanicoccus sp.]|jgi:alpha-beta hydrolase superfamily lysophospholipase
MDLDNVKSAIKPLDLSRLPSCTVQERAYFKHYGIDFEEKCDKIDHYFGSINSDRFTIATHFFKNRKADKTCFILHGYYDHSGLFRHVVEYCLQRNYSVVIFDLPGHGLSSGTTASIDSFLHYQTVLADISGFFFDATPKPWHAIAQSTGGAILSEFVLSNRRRIFQKIVMLAPLIYPKKWRVSKLTHLLSKNFIKKIPRNFADNSGDRDFLNFLKHRDPLQSRYLPMQWVAALDDWIGRFMSLVAAGCERADLTKDNSGCEASCEPLIIQGQCDGTVDWKKNVPIYEEKFPGLETYFIARGKHQLANETPEILGEIYGVMDRYFSIERSPSLQRVSR